MEHLIHEKFDQGLMSPEDITLLLSKTMREVTERKVTLRYVTTVSRLALALSRTIETVDLKKRLELIEQVLKQRKTR